MVRKSSRKRRPVKYQDHATEAELSEEINILEKEFPERKKIMKVVEKPTEESEKVTEEEKKPKPIKTKRVVDEEDYEPEASPPHRYSSEEESDEEYDSSPPPRRKLKRKQNSYTAPQNHKRRRFNKESEEERRYKLMRRAEAEQNIRRLQLQQSLRKQREHNLELMSCYKCGTRCHPMASDVVVYKAGNAHPNSGARWALCSATCRRYFRGGCWRCGIPCRDVVFTRDGEEGCENCTTRHAEYGYGQHTPMGRFYRELWLSSERIDAVPPGPLMDP